MPTNTTWIVAADASRARMLQVTDRHLEEIEDLVNPEARANERDLRSDAEPRLNAHGGMGGGGRTGGPASDRQEQTGVIEHSVQVFAKEIGRYLEKARTDHRYDELCLVAPPKFLGALRAELTKDVEKLVVRELPKELSGLRTRDLEAYLKSQENT
jgi:protein required for attachment to host cells